MNLLALAAVLLWHPLPPVPDRGYSSVEGVRAGPLAVFVAGATYDATTVKARAVDLRTGRWRRLPAVPLHWRAHQNVVAAERRVIVWGGASNRGPHADGAMLDHGAWHRIARAPLRGTHAAVWTGREMLVPDGAAYGPGRDRWRAIARAPFRARAAVWSGRRLLTLGAREAAAYDPARDRWTRVASPPIRALDSPRAVWTGTRMLVFTGARGAAYDPRRDRWRLMGRPPLVHRSNFTAVWDSARLLVWGGVRHGCGGCFLDDGAALDPRRHRWRRLPRAPLAPRDRHAAVPFRGGMVVWGGCCRRGRPQLADGAIAANRSPRAAAGSGPRRRAASPRCRGAARRR